MNNSQEVVKIIKATAKEQGKAIGKMLEDCELSKNALSSMQSGYLPRIENLAKIADYLDVSVDYLLGREEKTLTVGRRNRLQGAVIIKKAPDTEVKSYTTDSPVRDAIIDKVKELDDAQLDRLLGYLEALTEG